MALKDDLIAKVNEFVDSAWNVTDGYVVPGEGDLTFSNTGKRLEVCVLYADIYKSTDMVDSLDDTKAAEYYKAFLHCAAKIIIKNNGVVTAYDGDRVMAVFTGGAKVIEAITTAFNINSAVRTIINPKFSSYYGILHRPLKHTVGIDCGKVLVAKVGVRVDSDLVWVGQPSNYAAKLNSFDNLEIDYSTRITPEVFAQLPPRLLNYPNGDLIWQGLYTNGSKKSHYRTNASIELD